MVLAGSKSRVSATMVTTIAHSLGVVIYSSYRSSSSCGDYESSCGQNTTTGS